MSQATTNIPEITSSLDLEASQSDIRLATIDGETVLDTQPSEEVKTWIISVVKLRIEEILDDLLYSTHRVWKWWELIKMWKLRTMYKEDDPRLEERCKAAGTTAEDFRIMLESQWKQGTKEGDPRVIPSRAKFRWRFWDEAPQIYNILRGEMKLVAWRPPIESEFKQASLSHQEDIKAWEVWAFWYRYFRPESAIAFDQNRIAAAREQGIPINKKFRPRFTKEEQKLGINVSPIKEHDFTNRCKKRAIKNNKYWFLTSTLFTISCIVSDFTAAKQWKHK